MPSWFAKVVSAIACFFSPTVWKAIVAGFKVEISCVAFKEGK